MTPEERAELEAAEVERRRRAESPEERAAAENLRDRACELGPGASGKAEFLARMKATGERVAANGADRPPTPPPTPPAPGIPPAGDEDARERLRAVPWGNEAHRLYAHIAKGGEVPERRVPTDDLELVRRVREYMPANEWEQFCRVLGCVADSILSDAERQAGGWSWSILDWTPPWWRGEGPPVVGGRLLAADERTGPDTHQVVFLSMAEVHDAERQTGTVGVFLSLFSAWLECVPIKAPYVRSRDVLILTRQVAHVEDAAEGFYLSRFGKAAHRDPSTDQLLLGFEHPDMEGPTLPANIWTLALAEAEKRGPGLPAALRIFLAALIRVPLYARRVESPTDPPVTLVDLTLRTFLTWIYGGRTRPGEFWPVLMGAREVLHSRDAEVPYEWDGVLWDRPVLRLDWPRTYHRRLLDAVWPVSVHLPPGDGNGAPIMEARLRYWWTRDAACARALINLAYRWHIEGKRLVPARKGKHTHWLQIRDPKVYDRITDRHREHLPFPPGTGARRRRQRIDEGDAALQRLVKEGDAIAVDGRLLPPARWLARNDDGNGAP